VNSLELKVSVCKSVVFSPSFFLETASVGHIYNRFKKQCMYIYARISSR
jgi:hypothetical protein